MSVNVVCMKWGALYGAHYVNRLYHGVRRNMQRPFRFVCFTDDTNGIIDDVECHPLPSVEFSDAEEDRRWLKLGVLRKDIADLKGATLFLDLDVVVIDSIDDFFDYEPGTFCISHDWWMPYKHLISEVMKRPKVGNTSVFRFEAGSMNFIVEKFEEHSTEVLQQFALEQAYITHEVGNRIRWWPQQWVSSFRRHCRPVFPMNLLVSPSIRAGTRIVAFHGLPKLDQAAKGYMTRYPHKICRPSPWISEHWRTDD